MNQKKYKALMLDVDGTLVENRKDAMPSQKVTEAITKAREKIHVGIVTGRPMFYMHDIFSHLKLSGPAILDTGTVIVDTETKKVLWEKTLSMEHMEKIVPILKPYKERIMISDNYEEIPWKDNYVPKKLFGFFSAGYTLKEASDIEKQISHISTLIMHKMLSWKGKDLVDIYITDVQATKQHGLLEVAKMLQIETEDMIGVGDGYNDFPLLMTCGLKIAMGNAIEDLKAIADYVAPSVTDDGLVDVIEKFIL